MNGKTNQTSDDKSGKLLARMNFASTSIPLPNGSTLLTKVDLQEDGGFYVGQSIIARDNSVTATETCFYCGDTKLGCMTCPKGQSPHGDCVKRTIKCVSDKVIPKWQPASIVFGARHSHD